MPQRTSLYTSHCNRWGTKGCGSSICKTAKNIVLVKGHIPCAILFVGEAPGESENVVGLPFIGPAGRLLDSIVNRALGPPTSPDRLRIAFTNLVCCIPRDPEEGGKASEPLPEDVESCAPRLAELVKICQPKLIVAVGTQARDYLDPRYKGGVSSLFYDVIPTIDIHHPAFILRQTIAAQSLMVQKCVVAISNGVEEYIV